MSHKKIRIVTLSGPTASGKTALSIQICKRFGGEVISADSMQIYRYMNIATAKPSLEEMQSIKHHLIDFLSPDETYSVANYVKDAKEAAIAIASRGLLPVICGGTGLYIDNLVDGTVFTEGETDLELRRKLIERYNEEGIEPLLSELRSVDEESYHRLSEEINPKRIIRALEVYYTTGISQTEQNRLSKASESIFTATQIALDFRNREVLYDRINRRVDIMLENGLLKETEEFYNSNFSNTAVQAIGYKELLPYLNGEISLEDAVESLKRSTRRYAKRQLTWFRRNKNIKWFYVDDYMDEETLINDVCDYLISEGFENNEG